MQNLLSVLLTHKRVFLLVFETEVTYFTQILHLNQIQISNLKELLAKEPFKRAQLSDSENCSHKRRLCAYLQRQERTII